MVSAAEQLAANLNFSALAKAEELKKRIWFTLGALLVYRLGTYIPLPGIDPSAWDQIFRSQAGGILGMFNMFSGGGIHRMAIFALNIMPYNVVIRVVLAAFALVALFVRDYGIAFAACVPVLTVIGYWVIYRRKTEAGEPEVVELEAGALGLSGGGGALGTMS